MQQQTPKKSIGAILAFIVTALIASILLISAFVYLVGDLIGSHLLAMVIVGGVCAIASWMIYTLSLRPTLRRWEEQLTTIFEVAQAARRAYDLAMEHIISRIFKMWE